MKKMFFAWAVPAFAGLLPAHHTWVTTFRPVGACPPETEGYWYCKGSCHLTPPSNDDAVLLVSQIGDTSFANEVATPNDESADCGLRYGVDGVCHQMANRILYATAVDHQTPITVRGAKGYNLSVTIYGEYGGLGSPEVQRAWARRVESWLTESED